MAVHVKFFLARTITNARILLFSRRRGTSSPRRTSRSIAFHSFPFFADRARSPVLASVFRNVLINVIHVRKRIAKLFFFPEENEICPAAVLLAVFFASERRTKDCAVTVNLLNGYWRWRVTYYFVCVTMANTVRSSTRTCFRIKNVRCSSSWRKQCDLFTARAFRKYFLIKQ